ncbi:MAG TPA: thiamine-phosphate kinase [Candidatus Omnitrophota bacterium]|nr:thiamine-phosphate kinase [Candidatus Omnitrophota bacterium]
MNKKLLLKDAGEEGLIRRLRMFFPPCPRIPMGIGDDTAVLPYTRQAYLLFTTDASVDGIDFRLAKIGPEAIGRKVLAQNLSDIAAMGGIPLYGVMTLGVPPSFPVDFVEEFYAGVKKLSRRFNMKIVGGDFSRSKVFFASCALIGAVEKKYAVFRKNARTGDFIFVTGTLGGSILGRHFCFAPRIREARFLVRKFRPHAMIDVSDGLTRDLGHLLDESGKSAVLYADRIPVSEAAKVLARKTGKKPLEHALGDGEDFELLFTVSPGDGKKLMALKKVAGTAVHFIGRVRKGKGLFIQSSEKSLERKRIPCKGFSHF